MKTRNSINCFARAGLVVALAGCAASSRADDPRTNSWLTTYSGKYSRVYTNDDAKASGTSATTWSNGTQSQSTPAYSGVQEVFSSSNWVYLRSTGLGSHVMGPWYLDAAHSNIFPNFPVNTKTLFRIPRTPAVPATKTATGGGAIGYFVDGVAMFNSWDAFYWNGSADTGGGGTGYWNRDAYINEGLSFDPANAHQPQDGTYHYHANPPALRYLLGDHVDYNSSSKAYSESTNAAAKHSPILGWMSDGYPLYGPYGYASASNSAGGIRRMVSGYVLRNGQYGTSNLTANGRVTIPPWAARLFNVSSNQSGPAVSSSYPLGRYMEDNDYLSDLGYTQGVDFDLDEYNGRRCVTPEFPGGTYAYFVAVSSNGTPVYPYNIGRGFYGSPAGGSVTSIAETVVTNFEGGPNSTLALSAPAISNNTVTLVWTSVDGGTYQIESETSFTSGWQTNMTGVASQGVTTRTNLSGTNTQAYFRVARTALAGYDSAGTTSGGGSTSVAPGGSASRGATVTVTITLPSNPPWPPANAPITSVTLAGTISGTAISDAVQGAVQATFAIPANAPTNAQNVVVIFNMGPTYTLTNGFTIN
jgi:hypothetical protein